MATSKLQKYVGELLDKKFPQYSIQENSRPDWLISPNLTRLELDYFIPELKIAFEIQGDQHYKFIPFFHKDYADFEKRQKYDKEKRNLCEGRGIKLIEISGTLDAIMAVDNIENDYVQQPNKYSLGNELPETPVYPEGRKNQIKRKIKHERIIKRKELEAIDQYKKDYYSKILYGDPVATIKNKLDEIQKFINALTSYRAAHNNVGIRYFRFDYLSAAEMKVVLGKSVD